MNERASSPEKTVAKLEAILIEGQSMTGVMFDNVDNVMTECIADYREWNMNLR